jgi:hypothetical protein
VGEREGERELARLTEKKKAKIAVMKEVRRAREKRERERQRKRTAREDEV